MEANKSTRTKALIFSIFVHSTILLAIGMASFEVVRQTVTEMEFTDDARPATQEVEVIDSKTAVTKPAEELPAKEEVVQVKPFVEQKSAAAAKPVTKTKPAAKAKVAVLPPAPKAETQDAVETVEESPVVVPPTAADDEIAVSDEDAPKPEETKAEAPVIAQELPVKEEVKVEDPQEKIPEQEVAKTEAGLKPEQEADDEEDWADEIRQAAIPTAQASDKPTTVRAAPATTTNGNGSGQVRSFTELTPRGKNPNAVYPQTARLQKVEGTTVLRFKVDGTGNVSEVWVHQSSGHRPFDDEAMKTQKLWKYEPGKTGTFQKPWVFQLKGPAEDMPYRIKR